MRRKQDKREGMKNSDIESKKYDKRLTKEERMALWFDENGNKRCCTCKEYKPKELFSKDKRGWGGLGYSCKPCASARTIKHHHRRMKEDPSYREGKRRRAIKSAWGMSVEQYDALLEKQGGKCAICFTDTPKGGWHLDHDHSTGKIRKFLCNPCNRGLGYLQDSEELLMKALNYLQEHSKEGRSP